jgi:hypothetical protein
MLRASTALAAAATVAALAVSTATASPGSTKPLQPNPNSHTATHTRNLNDVEAIDFAVKDGTSNTIFYAERGASFTVDIGTSKAARKSSVRPPTPRTNLTRAKGGPNGIIAVLIGL